MELENKLFTTVLNLHLNELEILGVCIECACAHTHYVFMLSISSSCAILPFALCLLTHLNVLFSFHCVHYGSSTFYFSRSLLLMCVWMSAYVAQWIKCSVYAQPSASLTKKLRVVRLNLAIKTAAKIRSTTIKCKQKHRSKKSQWAQALFVHTFISFILQHGLEQIASRDSFSSSSIASSRTYAIPMPYSSNKCLKIAADHISASSEVFCLYLIKPFLTIDVVVYTFFYRWLKNS